MNMARAATIPAGIDRVEGDDAVVVGQLGAAQKALSEGVLIRVRPHVRIARIISLRVALPDFDPRASYRAAVTI